ncbi:MAG: lysoplasmalogenase [Coriobacteriia bacterium]|nr:lysoplasmalogenase [Coriobacteriia bacterium]
MTVGIALTAVGLLGTLYADFRESVGLRWVCKPLASVGFLVIAFTPVSHGGAVNALHLGLALSALGDVALVPRSKRLFLLGLCSFALAHVAYLTYFVSASVRKPGDFTVAAGAAALVLFMVVGHRVWKWLEPHAGSMRLPVRVYVLIVSLMAASAAASMSAPATEVLLAPLGAILFYLSDLSVARDRFVAHDFVNKLWGLPLYYVGQVLIAIAATR